LTSFHERNHRRAKEREFYTFQSSKGFNKDVKQKRIGFRLHVFVKKRMKQRGDLVFEEIIPIREHYEDSASKDERDLYETVVR